MSSYIKQGEVEKLLINFNANPKESLEHAQNLQGHKGYIKKPIEQAHLSFVCGSCEQLLLNYNQAFLHLQEALALYRNEKNTKGELSCLKNLGTNFYKTGDYGESYRHFYQALELAHEDSESKTSIYVNLGVISFEMDRHIDALEYYYLAFKTLSPEDMEQRSIILNNLGECYFQLGEREKALYHFQQAIILFKQLKHQYNLAYCYCQTSSLLLKMKEHRKAEEFLQKADVLNKELGSPTISIGILKNYGLLEKERSQLDVAFSYINQALLLAEKYDETKQQCLCLLELKEIAKKQNASELALEYLEEYTRIKDLFVKQESQHSLAMLNSRIQIESLRKEKERVDDINDHLEKLNDEMMLINHLAKDITSSLDLQEMARYLKQIFKEMFQVSIIGLGIYDPQGQKIHFNHFFSEDREVASFSHSMSRKGSLAVDCIKKKKALCFNTKKEILKYTGSKEDHKEESVVYIPLIMKDRILGILTIQSEQPHSFNNELFELLKSLSSFISIAVSNALNHTRIQQLNEQLLDDKEALESAYGEIEYLACHDSLTGLANRSLLEDFFHRCKAATLRRKQSMAVLFIDLDGFKEINDTHGHEGGDRILVSIAQVLQRTIRNTDMVARYGGDEYVIILREIKSNKALTLLVEKLRDSIENPISMGKRKLKVGASLGVAIYPEDGTNLDELLKVADHRMYENKGQRKEEFKRLNKVIH